MSLPVNLLRSSFDALAPRADELAARFYDRLFERHPELAPHFAATDLDEQRRKLVQSLVVIVRSLDRPAALEKYLSELGGRHAELGITEDEYRPVGETLLETLAELAGPELWTPEVDAAWRAAVTVVAERMIAGGRQHLSQLVAHSPLLSAAVRSPQPISLRDAAAPPWNADPRPQSERTPMSVTSAVTSKNGGGAAPLNQFFATPDAAGGPSAPGAGDAAALHAELEEARENQRALTLLFGALAKAKDYADAVRLALETVREAFGWEYASYWTINRRDQKLHYALDSGNASSEFRRVAEAAAFAEGEGLNGRAWRQRELVFVDDLAKVTDCVRAPAASRAGLKSGVAFPIVQFGEVLGTMDFFVSRTLTMSPARLETLRNVGRLVSYALLEMDSARMKSMIENLPINVITANRDAEIEYLNPSAVNTLRKIEHLLPKPVDELQGEKFDIFHKNPEFQRRIVGNPRNLPHKAQIKVGDEILDLLVSAILDKDGNYLGPMITWDIVTEKVRTDAEMTRVQNMMDNMPLNVMMANRDLEIVYINPASLNTLKKLEHRLPVPVNQIKGQKIDIFHSRPDDQRRLLSDPRNLPHNAKIRLGDDWLELKVFAINDKQGNYIGPMVTWGVITDKVKLADDFERDVKGVVEIVTSAATEMQANSKGLAAASEETARQSQVVAAASEQATRNVEAVSSAAEELSKSIAEISRHVQDASKMTSLAVRDADKTNDTIKQLGDSSNEIGQVVKVITSIAQQTNLLALNATIEAARAGEAGKGFAVVANEVKELARQTAKATEEISQKIAAIQSATGVAVSAIGAIGDSIRHINEISTTIASAVEEQTAATNEISRNVAEAARGTAEVSSNIAGVSQAADEGGRGAGDILAASEGLAAESVRLDQVTNAFLKRMRAM